MTACCAPSTSATTRCDTWEDHEQWGLPKPEGGDRGRGQHLDPARDHLPLVCRGRAVAAQHPAAAHAGADCGGRDQVHRPRRLCQRALQRRQRAARRGRSCWWRGRSTPSRSSRPAASRLRPSPPAPRAARGAAPGWPGWRSPPSCWSPLTPTSAGADGSPGAGDCAAAWWLNALPNAVRWRPLLHDVNSLPDPEDVRSWVLRGLERARHPVT